MREPAFWSKPPGAAAALLKPAAMLYGAIAQARMRRRGSAAGIPVVCVGNLTLGGAGKTPTALVIGRMLSDVGEKPYFLSRGYGGRLSGPLLVDPARHRADEVGDEPLLLARLARTVVARDRLAGAALARKAGASCVVMDDGFQNPRLAKELAILVVDGRRGIGNGQVFPAGPLRAPLAAQLDRAHAIVVIGEVKAAAEIVMAAKAIPMFSARLEPDFRDLAALAGHRVLAFAGIGDPDKFFSTLREAGIDVRGRRAFADHHFYTAGDCAALMAGAQAQGLLPVTTQKDMMRLVGRPEAAALAAAARTLPITLILENSAGFEALLRNGLSLSSPARADRAAASPPPG